MATQSVMKSTEARKLSVVTEAAETKKTVEKGTVPKLLHARTINEIVAGLLIADYAEKVEMKITLLRMAREGVEA
ncbi:MAG: hypothetical protein NT157_01340 [Candidatus Micrarchaeota archaeon]|nr:hypothetical protein [Candidatus Micrarchaeota archaeon]